MSEDREVLLTLYVLRVKFRSRLLASFRRVLPPAVAHVAFEQAIDAVHRLTPQEVHRHVRRKL